MNNLLNKRKLEIEEAEKGCGSLYGIGKSTCIGKVNISNEYFCPKCKEKLQTLKKILAEEKEFVKSLEAIRKKHINADCSNVSQEICMAYKTAVIDIFKEIDKISIHSPQLEASNDNQKLLSVDDEPEKDYNLLMDSQSGSLDNLCECGYPKQFHPIHISGKEVQKQGEVFLNWLCQEFKPKQTGEKE